MQEKNDLCIVCDKPTLEGIIMDDYMIPMCTKCNKVILYQLNMIWYKIDQEESGIIEKIMN